MASPALHRNSIRLRMTVALTAAVASVLFLVCGGIVGAEYFIDTRRADETLEFAGRVVKDEWEENANTGTAPNWSAVTDEIHQDPESADMAILVLDSGSRVTFHTAGRIPSWPLPRGNEWRFHTERYLGGEAVIALPWFKTQRELATQTSALLGLSLLIVAISAMGAWWLVGRTLAPIGSLARQAQTASGESLRLQLTAPSPDAEVIELVDTLNGLLSRLADSVVQKSRFHAAASHELRTPLQALSGHLEVALSRPRSAGEYRVSLEEAREQTQRLASLVHDVLLLNRLDATSPATSNEPVALGDLCERIVSQLEPVIQRRGLQILIDVPSHVEVMATPTYLHVLVRNLIENAVKYADAQSPIAITAVCQSSGTAHASLEIHNRCLPIPSGDFNHLFEPFYRPDAARTSQTGGHGLGLAICKGIADLHSWELTMLQEDGGVRCVVQF